MGPITKGAVCLSFGCTLAMSLGLIHPIYYIFDFESMFWKLQLWRFFTGTVFLGKFGFPWLMSLATMYMYMRNHEEIDLKGKRADFVWMLTWIVGVLFVIALALGMATVGLSFIMAICWVWCRRNPTAMLSIYMFKFEANYFPWALVAFHLLMGMNIVDDIVGIVAGHVFIFLKDIMPKTHGKDLIPTPRWLIRYFPYERFGPYSVHEPAVRAPGQAVPPPAGGHNWGRGRQLGQ